MSATLTDYIALDLGWEQPCEECPDRAWTRGYFSPADGSAEPPTPYCDNADGCPVDVRVLRELQAQVEVACHFVAGVLTTCTRANCHGLLDELMDSISEILEDHYSGGSRVGHEAIRGQLREAVRMARARKVMAGVTS